MILSEMIQRAWSHRMKGEMFEVRAFLERIELSGDFESSSGADRAEIELLYGSMARFELKIDEALHWMEKARATRRAAGLPETFQLHFQIGLCFDAQSRFADSLKCYQEAFRRTEDFAERLLAKFNLAICQFHLGLSTKAATEYIVQALDGRNDHPYFGLLDQIRTIDLKQAFDGAEFDRLERHRFESMGHGLYVQAWLESLPWISHFESSPRQRFMDLAPESDLFLKDYRLGTLMSDGRMEDPNTANLIHLQVDRLYLLIWKWLAEPSAFLQKKLTQELALFPFATAHLSLTKGETWLLRSAGLWLVTFNASFRFFFEDWLGTAVSESDVRAPFFALDDRIRDAWLSGRLEEERTEILAKHPLLTEYVDLIAKMKRPGHAPAANADVLTVHVAHGRLQRGEQQVVSDPLTKLCVLLTESSSTTFEMVLSRAFEINGYDAFVHAPKLNNLFRRLRELLPEQVRLFGKNGRVYLEDPQGLLRIERGTDHERFFPEFHAATEVLEKRQSARLQQRIQVDYKAGLISSFADREDFRREELQTHFGFSKATMNRWLQTWVQDGSLEQLGAGPNLRYRVNRAAQDLRTKN